VTSVPLAFAKGTYILSKNVEKVAGADLVSIEEDVPSAFVNGILVLEKDATLEGLESPVF
jgi:hypothetical protein